MFATYNPTNPGMKLNIREVPDGVIVGELAEGQTVTVEVIEKGWCKTEYGYIDARFVTVTDSPEESSKKEENQPEAPEEPEAPEAPANPEQAETVGSEPVETGGSENNGEPASPEGAQDGDSAKINEMTKPKLIELAKNSGIEVKQAMSKDEIIEAILEGAND